MIRIILIIAAALGMAALGAHWITDGNLTYFFWGMFMLAFVFPEDWVPTFTRKQP